MEKRLPLRLRSLAELRTEAVVYRSMAATARGTDVRAGLLRLADRFDALADQRRNEPVPCCLRYEAAGVTGD